MFKTDAAQGYSYSKMSWIIYQLILFMSRRGSLLPPPGSVWPSGAFVLLRWIPATCPWQQRRPIFRPLRWRYRRAPREFGLLCRLGVFFSCLGERRLLGRWSRSGKKKKEKRKEKLSKTLCSCPIITHTGEKKITDFLFFFILPPTKTHGAAQKLDPLI